jgi:predicted thioesterase
LIHGEEGFARRLYLRPMGGKLDVGRSYQSQTRVEEWMTAEKAGNRGVDVLSTPMLLQLIEEAATACLGPMLGPNDVSLGAHVDLTHLAPTPVGFIVRTEVEVIGVNGRRVTFAVAAFDEREKIAEGTHERYVVDRSRFLANLEEKQS